VVRSPRLIGEPDGHREVVARLLPEGRPISAPPCVSRHVVWRMISLVIRSVWPGAKNGWWPIPGTIAKRAAGM
jgi:hypothetical protein